MTDESSRDENLYKDEVAYLYEGQVPRSDKPGLVSRLTSRFSGGVLHPDANNDEVPAPPLGEDE